MSIAAILVAAVLAAVVCGVTICLRLHYRRLPQAHGLLTGNQRACAVTPSVDDRDAPPRQGMEEYADTVSEGELIAEAEALQAHLRRRAPIVAKQEGYTSILASAERLGDSANVRRRAACTRVPSPRGGEPVRVIDPRTGFFRRGEFRNDTSGRVCDADANTELLVNMKLKDMQVSGTGWVANLHPSDFVAVMKRWLFSVEKRHTFVMKYRFRHPYRTIYACAVATPVYTDGVYSGTRGYNWHLDKDTWEELKF